ncbi:MAG: cation transporter [Bacteroidales bacterium]|nr:cation transporter [Bacteroidales bacterium]
MEKNQSKSHSHSHHHTHHGDVKNIKVAFFLNFSFAIIEIIGGFLTNSVAILSDAVHDLGDSLSLGLAWYFQKYSRKKSDNIYTYGYRRFSLVGALANSLVLIVGSILILTEAIPRIFNPQQAHPQGMMLLAVLGVAVNGFAMLRLRKGKSLNEKVVSLHLMEDVLGWIAVLIGAVIMYFWDVPVIDPILSLLIAGYVLFNVFKNMRELFRILLQGAPQEINSEHIQAEILKIDSVKDIHDVHLWSVDGIYNVMTIHVILDEKKSMEELSYMKKDIRNRLINKGIEHVTLEFETEDEECVLDDCSNPDLQVE